MGGRQCAGTMEVEVYLALNHIGFVTHVKIQALYNAAQTRQLVKPTTWDGHHMMMYKLLSINKVMTFQSTTSCLMEVFVTFWKVFRLLQIVITAFEVKIFVLKKQG